MSVDQKISVLRKEAERLIEENEKIQASYRDKLGMIVKLVAENAVLERKVDTLTRERDQAMDVVRAVEWTPHTGDPFCPSCGWVKGDGHTPGCKLAEVIRLVPKTCEKCKGEKIIRDGNRVDACPECLPRDA